MRNEFLNEAELLQNQKPDRVIALYRNNIRRGFLFIGKDNHSTWLLSSADGAKETRPKPLDRFAYEFTKKSSNPKLEQAWRSLSGNLGELCGSWRLGENLPPMEV